MGCLGVLSLSGRAHLPWKRLKPDAKMGGPLHKAQAAVLGSVLWSALPPRRPWGKGPVAVGTQRQSPQVGVA